MVIDKTAQGRRTFTPREDTGAGGVLTRFRLSARTDAAAGRDEADDLSCGAPNGAGDVPKNRIGHGASSTPPFGCDGTARPDVGTPGRDFGATPAAPTCAAPSPFDPAAHVACTRSPFTVAPGAPSFGCPHTAHTSPVTLRLPGLEAGCVEQVRLRLTGKLGLAFELANRDGLPARGARRIALGKAEPRPRWPLGRQETVPDALTYFRAKRVFIHDRESRQRLPLQPSEHRVNI